MNCTIVLIHWEQQAWLVAYGPNTPTSGQFALGCLILDVEKKSTQFAIMHCIHLDCYPDLWIIPLCQPIESNSPDCSSGPKIGLVCERHILSSANPIANSKFKLYFVCSKLFILTCSMAIITTLLPGVSASHHLVIVPLQAMGQSCHRCNCSCCGSVAISLSLSLLLSAITAALAA